MQLCIGTAKGIVIVDPERVGPPLLALADPSSIWCMAQDAGNPALLYAGSVHNAQAGSARGRGSLARSNDGGRSWTDITPGAARDEEVWSVAAPPGRPGTVFIGTSHARILSSENGGQSFRECAAFLKLPGRERWGFPLQQRMPHVRAISFGPKDPSVMYVAVEEGGIFRSPDGGRTFAPLNRRVYSDIHGVAADPDDPARLFVTTGRGFYRSDDLGASWSYIKGLSRPYVVALAAVPARDGGGIYIAGAAGPPPLWPLGAAGADGLVLCSRDHGRSFTPLPSPDGVVHPARGMVMRLLAHPERGAELFGIMSDGVLIHLDGRAGVVRTITEKLPPAYDLAALP